mmetsp:Transcript_25316/g.33696  ORF Transcript_25316/g.33696 Transcript_25316/m.33696 type:complete len:135 (-) Transcript_25316:1013-1417(-)
MKSSISSSLFVIATFLLTSMTEAGRASMEKPKLPEGVRAFVDLLYNSYKIFVWSCFFILLFGYFFMRNYCKMEINERLRWFFSHLIHERHYFFSFLSPPPLFILARNSFVHQKRVMLLQLLENACAIGNIKMDV